MATTRIHGTKSRSDSATGLLAGAERTAVPVRSPPGALQRHLGNQGVRAIQAKLRVGPVDDPFEREADRMAEQVVRREALGSTAAGAAATDDDDLIRRQVDDDELFDEELEEVVQAQAAPGGLRGEVEEETGLEGELRRSRSGGEPLPENLRADMESSFGADFSSVRLHRDTRAESMARSLNALAFTYGDHVYFGAGNFSPATESGRRLLGHELTHVVQQNPGVGRGAPEVQRAPAGAPPTIQAEIRLRGADGKLLRVLPIRTTGVYTGLNGVASGVYDATIAKQGERFSVTFRAPDERTRSLEILASGESSQEIRQALESAASAALVVDNPLLALPEELAGPSDAEGGGGAAEKENEGGATASVDVEKGIEQEKEEGGTAEKKAGSQYGYLGWIDFLPQEVIDVLEDVAEQMEGFDEFVALRELLVNLKDFDEYLKELESWFQSPDALLEVVLGLRGDQARIDAIAAWAKKKSTTTLKLKNKNAKGLLKIAQTVKKLLVELKRVLGSILTVRQKFVEVFESVGAIVLGIQGLEELFDLAKDVAGGDKERLERLLGDVANEASREIHAVLEAVRKKVRMAAVDVKSFQFVTPDAVAQTLTGLFFKLIPGPVGWITRRIAPERLKSAIADDLVRPLLGDSLLDPINKPIQDLLAESLAPFVERAGKEIGEVVDAVETPLIEEIVPGLRDLVLKGVDGVVQRDAKPAAGEDVEERLPYAASLMGGSAGAALPGGVRQDMEQSFGHSFADVRVHSDAPAQAASRLLRANAFTVGRDVYFDRGRYAPESSAGRRLLAHELTHVVQQGFGPADEVARRDAAATVKKLGKNLAAAALKALTRELEISEQDIQEAARIKKYVTGRLLGQPPSSIEGTPAARGYNLIRSKKGGKGRITGIRRKLKFRRFIDDLQIKGGKIAVKAAAPEPGSLDNPFEILWPKPRSIDYQPLYFGGVVNKPKKQKTLKSQLGKNDATGNEIKKYTPHDSVELAPGTTPSGSKAVAGIRLGLSRRYRIKTGTVVGPLSNATTPGGELLNDVLEPYGFRAGLEGRDADHVHEIQVGGRDVIQNLWPLDKDINQKAGTSLNNTKAWYPVSGKEIRISKLKRNLSRKYYFKVMGFRY